MDEKPGKPFQFSLKWLLLSIGVIALSLLLWRTNLELERTKNELLRLKELHASVVEAAANRERAVEIERQHWQTLAREREARIAELRAD